LDDLQVICLEKNGNSKPKIHRTVSFSMKKILILLIISLSFVHTAWCEQSDNAVIDFLKEEYDVTLTSGNSITFFEKGKDKYEDLLAVLKEARESIHVEYFNFRNDSITALLFNIFREKAKEGVEIRIIFDAFGNMSNDMPLSKGHIQEIQSQGIEIVCFDPIKFPWINHAFHRDHRKIIIVDGMIAYTGGMNVADYYITGKVELGHWKDLHTRIEGDAVGDLQSVFIKFWNKITKQNIQGTKYYPGTRDPRIYFSHIRRQHELSIKNVNIGVINRDAQLTPDIIHDTFIQSIKNAKTHIQIVNPYFTLCHHIKRALKQATERGVRVEIMISEKCDIPITPLVAENNVNQLMKAGAEIYFYQGGFHHGKYMIIDDNWAFLGSANLNSRSLAYDYECNLIIVNNDATKALQSIFEKDKTNQCYKLTPEIWKTRSKSKRFWGKFFTIIRPFI